MTAKTYESTFKAMGFDNTEDLSRAPRIKKTVDCDVQLEKVSEPNKRNTGAGYKDSQVSDAAYEKLVMEGLA